MKFYEVHPDLPVTSDDGREVHHLEGFRVTLRPAPGICMGPDNQLGDCTVLPLGKSITRYLGHREDGAEAFRLLFGKLTDTTAGLCIVAQTEEESRKDNRALLLIDVSTDPEADVTTKIVDAHGRTRPETVTATNEGGCGRLLCLFRPGDGLFVNTTWRRQAQQVRHKFILEWDGSHLIEIPCHRERRPRHQRQQVVPHLDVTSSAP